MQVLIAQAIGSLIITCATFASAMLVMYLVNKVGLLRVSAEGENYGLDLHEHGISAYPEYMITSLGRPSGMPLEESSFEASKIGSTGIQTTQLKRELL